MADIELEMLPVSPVGPTIDDLRARLRQELHDEDEDTYRWTDEVLDGHLNRAVRELSLSLPRQHKTIINASPGSREISLAGLVSLVRVDAVEYPTGRWPQSLVQFSLYGATLTLHTPAAPSSAEPVAVYWAGLHTLDETASTLPPRLEDIGLTGAAGYAAIELASFATNRANVSGTAAFEGYKAWGEERLSQFREALKSLGSEARLRSASLYRPATDTSRNTVQWPG